MTSRQSPGTCCAASTTRLCQGNEIKMGKESSRVSHNRDKRPAQETEAVLPGTLCHPFP